MFLTHYGLTRYSAATFLSHSLIYSDNVAVHFVISEAVK